MSRNRVVLDIKPRNSLVIDTKSRNKLVLDRKPNESVFGEVSWTAVDLNAGMSMGPGWYMYVTYPTYSLNRV